MESLPWSLCYGVFAMESLPWGLCYFLSGVLILLFNFEQYNYLVATYACSPLILLFFRVNADTLASQKVT